MSGKYQRFVFLNALLILTSICLICPHPSADVMYEEDFQSGRADGLNLEPGWEIARKDGNYLLSGNGHAWATLERGAGWTDYSFTFRVKLVKGAVHVNVRVSETGGFGRYFIGFNKNNLYLTRQNGDQFNSLIERCYPKKLNEWHKVKINVKGNRVQVVVDGKLSLDYTDSNPVREGSIAFETLDDSQAHIDDVKVSTFARFAEKSELEPIRAHRKGGMLTSDESWSGEVYVCTTVVVPEGVTLTIKPGTVVKFRHDRGYKVPGDGAGLKVEGGTVKAVGTPDEQIWFTSDAEELINGDWHGISLYNTDDSVFDYVIVEYGQIGIEQFNSKVVVSNSIIRWNNSEGLYAEKSKPVFKNNTIYSNAYHEIALEQYNEARIVNNIIRDGNFGVHHEKTKSFIEGNYFKNEHVAITAGMDSDITVKRNKFENIDDSPPIEYDHTCSATIEENDYENDWTTVPVPEFDYNNLKKTELGYIPGDPEGKHNYIYPPVDETRRVVKRIGKGLAFGWALTYANDYLWRFSLGTGKVGKQLDFIRVKPATGTYKRYRNDIIMNARGLTHDGENFWVNDFSLQKIFKFRLKGGYVEILDSFDIPEKEKGGTSGLTTDGNFLYLRSRDGSKVYKLDKTGDLVDEIYFPGRSIVWTGKYFWSVGGCGKGICKFNGQGKLVGEIYPAAQGTWAIAWDGDYLWTIQRTCELWDDPKIYQIEVVNDSM